MSFDLQGTETKTSKRVKSKSWLTMLLSAAFGLLMMAAVPEGAYALPVCSTTASISRCCKITKPGIYTVSSFTAKGSSGVCIRIKAANVDLSGRSTTQTITGPGPGSMKGLVIAPGADNALVSNLAMEGFDTGVEVDANKAYLSGVSGNSGGTGVVINGKGASCFTTFGGENAHNGMVVNGRGFFGINFGGDNNDANGIVFNPTAVGTFALEVAGENNGQTGVKIKDVTGGWFQSALAYGNGKYGVWLRGSSKISLVNFTAYSNAIAGVYLGCHANGPSGAPCASGIPPTNANTLTAAGLEATANGGSSPVQKYGVAIDSGNHLNSVVFVSGSGNSSDDGYDGNPNCDSNHWHSNGFTKIHPSCVEP